MGKIGRLFKVGKGSLAVSACIRVYLCRREASRIGKILPWLGGKLVGARQINGRVARRLERDCPGGKINLILYSKSMIVFYVFIEKPGHFGRPDEVITKWQMFTSYVIVRSRTYLNVRAS